MSDAVVSDALNTIFLNNLLFCTLPKAKEDMLLAQHHNDTEDKKYSETYITIDRCMGVLQDCCFPVYFHCFNALSSHHTLLFSFSFFLNSKFLWDEFEEEKKNHIVDEYIFLTFLSVVHGLYLEYVCERVTLAHLCLFGIMVCVTDPPLSLFVFEIRYGKEIDITDICNIVSNSLINISFYEMKKKNLDEQSAWVSSIFYVFN